MRDEKNRPDGPRFAVIVQDKEIWGPVFENSALHLGVSGIDDFVPQRLRLAFQLEGRLADWTKIVDGNGVSRGSVKAR